MALIDNQKTESGAIVITVLAEDLSNGVGARHPWSTLYTCTGPDGRAFDNRNIKTLRDVLRRRYGKVTVVIDDRRAPKIGGVTR